MTSLYSPYLKLYLIMKAGRKKVEVDLPDIKWDGKDFLIIIPKDTNAYNFLKENENISYDAQITDDRIFGRTTIGFEHGIISIKAESDFGYFITLNRNPNILRKGA